MKAECSIGKLELFITAEENGKTLLNLMEHYCQSSRNRYLMVQNHEILYNHQPVKDWQTVLHTHDQITILIPPQPYGFLPADKACTVVYEDDYVYAVHKDAGMIIYGDPQDTFCLASQAASWLQQKGLQIPVRYLHRLDRDTSGLVLFSKIPFFQPWLDRQMEEKKICRHYLAVCSGRCHKNQAFTFAAAIGRDRHQAGKYRVSDTGKPALTKAVCLDQKDGLILFGCTLETGRTHQIRVHLSAAGFPILNDPLYGIPDSRMKGMGLWADELEYQDPVSEEKIRIHDLDNPDFKLFEKECMR